MAKIPKGMNYVSGGTPAPVVVDDTETQESNIPEGMGYVPDDYVSPDAARRAEPEYVSTKERLADDTAQAIPTNPTTTAMPIEPEVTSIKSMSQDEDLVADILQYRQDRYGIEKDARAADLAFGQLFGGQELTNESIVDDFMDNHRFITGNSMDAASEVAWLRSLEQKEKDAVAAGNADDANEFAEQRARALRLYQKADSVGSLFNSKRYEQMSGLEIVGDIVDAVGGNVLAAVSDPLTVLTAGAGRVVGGILSSTGAAPLRQALISAATAAPIEAGGAAVVDIMVQNVEIEMGARKEIDYKRTATVSGIAALTAGAIGGGGKYMSAKKDMNEAAKKVSVSSREQLDDALATAKAKQTAAAKKANNQNPVMAKSIREDLSKGISDIYGDKVFKRNKKGDIIGLDSKVIKESDYAKGFFRNMDLDEDVIEPTISFDIFERTTAAVGDIIEGINSGSIKLIDDMPDGLTVKSLTGALQKGERVSERMLNIVSNVSEESMDSMIAAMGKYGVTRREIGAALFVDASMSGRVLGNLSKLQSKFTAAGRSKTAAEVAEEAEADAAMQVGSVFRRLEDIRRLTLVSGIATAARNNLSQVLRSGVDTLVYGMESAINPNKKFSMKGSVAQLKHTFFDPGDAANMAQFMLDAFPDQKMRFYNQYSEVSNKLAKGNPGQAALSKQSSGLSKVNAGLDKWENVVHTLNIANRFQEALYRNGAYTASIQRQLFDKGIDMVDVMQSGDMHKFIPEDMVAKAVDDALEFTYASQPKLGAFRMANNLIVKTGATIAIPFPRFMFKAMEMTYNYNITGAGTALMRMGMRKAQGGKVTDGMYRQLAEGIAGGLPMVALGYMLRDRDNGMAGSEWYMLEDGKGNQFDGRPYFPLTPYLLIGEMLHRGFDPDIVKETFDKKEMIEGFTGTNFRGTGPISLITQDLLNTSTDPLEMQDTYSNLGKYLGEAVSGYGQPIYQIADAASLFTDMNQRQLDYKEDPKYRDGVESFFNGFMQPMKLRAGKIEQEVGEAFGFEPADIPDKEDPRFEATPERVMPFMKLFFGATLERVPPKYVKDLYDLGYDYRNFMTRSSSPKVDRFMNREMGEAMNREIPEVLATAREEGVSPQETAALVGKWIQSAKSAIRAEIKLADDDTALAGMISRFRGQLVGSKRAAQEAFRNDNEGREPDMFSAEDVDMLLKYTQTHTRYSKQRPK